MAEVSRLHRANQSYLSAREVSHRLGIPLKTLEVWRYRRVGPPFYKFGRLVRYGASDLDAWEETCIQPKKRS